MTPSRSAVDKLGRRLAASDEVSDADATLLAELLEAHGAALAETEQRLRGLGLAPSVRVKTRSTLVEKVRRGTRLSSMNDLAGARIVRDMTWSEQDRIVDRISVALPGGELVDRRVRPSHGYRAVHYVAPVGGCRVEIQVRTLLQDVWAQMVESLADRWGRGIRYGEPPPDPERDAGGVTRRQLVGQLMQVSAGIYTIESVNDARRELERVAGRLVPSPLRNQLLAALVVTKPWTDQVVAVVERFPEMMRRAMADVQ